MPLDVKTFFNSLNKNTMHLVDDFYDRGAHFQDPVVNFTDREQIKKYYAHLYADVDSIEFQFFDEVKSGAQEVITWTMILVMKKLNGRKPVKVNGVSHIKFGGGEGKVIYHRDYFDMGAFIYEHIPVLGVVIRSIKG